MIKLGWMMLMLIHLEVLGQSSSLDSIYNLPDDTLKFKLLLKASKSFREGNYDSAVLIGKKAQELAAKIGFLKGQFKAYDNLGIIYSNKAQFEICLAMYKLSFEVASEMNDRELMLDAKFRVPRVYYFMGLNVKAIQAYEDIIKTLTDKKSDEERMARCWWELGDIYEQVNNFVMAEENLLKAVTYYASVADHDAVMRINISLGKLRRSQKNYAEAIEFFNKALAILEEHPEIPGKQHFTGYTKVQMAHNLFLSGDEEGALRYYNHALGILESEKATAETFYAFALAGKGEIFLNRKEYNKAIVFLNQAVRYYNSIKFYKPVFVTAYRNLIKAYEAAGNYKAADEGWNGLSIVQDSVNARQQKKELNELSVRYQVSQNEQQIAALEHRQRSVTIITSLISGIFLLATLFVWVYVGKQRLKHQREKRELELIGLRSQMNPHFIFNCLNSINHFILSSNIEVSSKYLTKFAKLIRLILDNSRNSFVLFDLELNALRLYLELESMRYNGKFTFTINVDEKLQKTEYKIPSMIIQPYIENAVWHGINPLKQQGLITLDFKLKENYLICTVEDNGVGRKRDVVANSTEKLSSSRKAHGTQITQDRLAVMVKEGYKKATVSIIDLKDATGNSLGTRVSIVMPYESYRSDSESTFFSSPRLFKSLSQ